MYNTPCSIGEPEVNVVEVAVCSLANDLCQLVVAGGDSMPGQSLPGLILERLWGVVYVSFLGAPHSVGVEG